MEKIEVFSLSPSLNYRRDIVYTEWKFNDNYQFNDKDKEEIKEFVDFNLSESGEFEKQIKTTLGEITVEFKKAISDEAEISRRSKDVKGYVYQEIKEIPISSEPTTAQSEPNIAQTESVNNLEQPITTRYYAVTKNGYVPYDCTKPPYENSGRTIFVNENGENCYGVTSEILFITDKEPFFFKLSLIAIPVIMFLVFIFLFNSEKEQNTTQIKTIQALNFEIATQKSNLDVNALAMAKQQAEFKTLQNKLKALEEQAKKAHAHNQNAAVKQNKLPNK